MRTTSTTPMTKSVSSDQVDRRWFIVDAEGQSLGRLSTKVASVLRGKHRPEFTPNADCGDFVVVLNAAKVKLTGDKLRQKLHHRHSGFPGGLKSLNYGDFLEKSPEKVIEKAVKGMLPKTTLGRKMATKLKVYSGTEHPHAAQKPTPLA